MGLTPEQARESIRQLCAAEGIGYCPLSRRFEGAETDGLRLRDTHLSARGHAAAADEVLACIRGRLGS